MPDETAPVPYECSEAERESDLAFVNENRLSMRSVANMIVGSRDMTGMVFVVILCATEADVEYFGVSPEMVGDMVTGFFRRELFQLGDDPGIPGSVPVLWMGRFTTSVDWFVFPNAKGGVS
jgi:hypothetical protein